LAVASSSESQVQRIIHAQVPLNGRDSVDQQRCAADQALDDGCHRGGVEKIQEHHRRGEQLVVVVAV
jgi:hypothetical protein